MTRNHTISNYHNMYDPYYLSPQIQCSKGCKITWKKDITCETTSFFNFFNTSTFNCTNSTDIEELELAIDYEIGYTFREKAIPKGILYYMGLVKDDFEDENSDLDSNNEDEIISNDQEV